MAWSDMSLLEREEFVADLVMIVIVAVGVGCILGAAWLFGIWPIKY